jgi:hypothetical protein
MVLYSVQGIIIASDDEIVFLYYWLALWWFALSFQFIWALMIYLILLIL